MSLIAVEFYGHPETIKTIGATGTKGKRQPQAYFAYHILQNKSETNCMTMKIQHRWVAFKSSLMTPESPRIALPRYFQAVANDRTHYGSFQIKAYLVKETGLQSDLWRWCFSTSVPDHIGWLNTQLLRIGHLASLAVKRLAVSRCRINSDRIIPRRTKSRRPRP